jgi:tetratricopeptide (TPR) repeat protein
MYNMITERVTALAKDSTSPIINFAIGREYEAIGQTASAVSFYLRCAEYGRDSHVELAYASLVRIGLIFDMQGGRDWSVTNALFQALEFSPVRPEAYYFLSKYYERQGQWREAYTYVSIGLQYQRVGTNLIPEYEGLPALQLQKATIAYMVGKQDEAFGLLYAMANTKNLPDSYRLAVSNNFKNFNLELDRIAIVLPVRDNGSYRAERLKECLASWQEQTEGLSDIHVIIDDDELDKFEYLKDYPFVDVHVRPNLRLIKKLNTVGPQLAEIYNYVAFVGDDIIFKSHWESRVIEYLKSVPAGLAWTNTMDRAHGDELCTHPIVTSNMIRALGFYGCPAVEHTFFDNFWMDITRDIGYNKYFEDIIWDHRRVGYAPDDMYWHIVNTQDANEVLYKAYKKDGYQQDLDKVKAIL